MNEKSINVKISKDDLKRVLTSDELKEVFGSDVIAKANAFDELLKLFTITVFDYSGERRISIIYRKEELELNASMLLKINLHSYRILKEVL